MWCLFCSGNDCSQTEALMLQRERLLSRDLQFAQQQLIAKDKLIMNLEEQNFSLHEQLKKVIRRAQLAQDAYNVTDKRHEHYERRYFLLLTFRTFIHLWNNFQSSRTDTLYYEIAMLECLLFLLVFN